jgi:hypothetical protein
MVSGSGGVEVTGEMTWTMDLEVVSMFYDYETIKMSLYVPPEQTETLGEWEGKIWRRLPSWMKVR